MTDEIIIILVYCFMAALCVFVTFTEDDPLRSKKDAVREIARSIVAIPFVIIACGISIVGVIGLPIYFIRCVYAFFTEQLYRIKRVAND